MLKLLSKLHLKLQPYTTSLKLDKAPQKNFLKHIEEKLPGYDHLSYTEKKYQSHLFISTWYKFLFYNIASLILIAPSILYLFYKACFRKDYNPKELIYFSPLIPIKLISKDAHLVKREFSLTLSEFFFILKSFKFKLLRPYFFLRIIWKSGLYFTALNKHSPKKAYCAEEMNFEGPFLSLICKKNSSLHINVLHGDKPFYIKDAFILFDEFYVWTDDFKNLFNDMNALVNEYKLFNPVPESHRKIKTSKPIFKYYAQYSKSDLEFEQRILNGLEYAKKENLRFILRPHPRHFGPSYLKVANKHNIRLESSNVKILDSIAEASVVCAEWSSVLFQAKFMSKKIVIDNTSKENITKLRELDFAILNQENISYLQD